MTRTLLIAVALWLLGGGAFWALARYNAKLDGRAGKGNAGQASGSPGQDGPVCGAYGPGGMVCDREPHDPFGRHEEDGIGWRGAARPPSYGRLP